MVSPFNRRPELLRKSRRLFRQQHLFLQQLTLTHVYFIVISYTESRINVVIVLPEESIQLNL
jgi:hypothetical protein